MPPSAGYFNHAIVTAVIENETVFLDPTGGACSFGVLPAVDQGADALVIRQGENDLIRLPIGEPQANGWRVKANVVVAEASPQ